MKTTSRLSPFWNQTLVSSCMLNTLPPETRICVTLYCTYEQRDYAIGWVATPLVDFTGRVRRGDHRLSMWMNERAKPIGTCESNYMSKVIMHMEFETPPLPVLFPNFFRSPGTQDKPTSDSTNDFRFPFLSLEYLKRQRILIMFDQTQSDQPPELRPSFSDKQRIRKCTKHPLWLVLKIWTQLSKKYSWILHRLPRDNLHDPL
jgi:hypothetical protein